jgi:hypothetical protein
MIHRDVSRHGNYQNKVIFSSYVTFLKSYKNVPSICFNFNFNFNLTLIYFTFYCILINIIVLTQKKYNFLYHLLLAITKIMIDCVNNTRQETGF